MTSAQVGKTETFLNNPVGYFIAQDPSPILVIQPTLEMAQTWSKDRFAPMLRDSPALKDLVQDPRARSSNNTILHKTFAGVISLWRELIVLALWLHVLFVLFF